MRRTRNVVRLIQNDISACATSGQQLMIHLEKFDV